MKQMKNWLNKEVIKLEFWFKGLFFFH